jgi:predicted nucleotidyltransferase
MRLTPDQARLIVGCVHQHFGTDATVMLFGSRLDDKARGGDVDLLVECEAPPTLRQRALVTMAIEQALALPVDIVAQQRGTPGSAFARIARSQAMPLHGCAAIAA